MSTMLQVLLVGINQIMDEGPREATVGG
jgi:hypothetical protein